MERPILSALLSCSGTFLTDNEKRLFAKYNPLGISLFGRNIDTPTQLKNLTDEIKNCINRDDVIIAVDQEGGRVRRLVEPYYRSYASPSLLGRMASEIDQDTAVKTTKEHAKLISSDLRNAGINMNFAPSLDLSYPNISPALKSRVFSNDIKLTTLLGKTMIEAYSDCGICPCIKHLPGLGRAVSDPHLELPVINESVNELKKTDFSPFRELNNAAAGMTAHIIIPEIDDYFPVTQSKKCIDTIIRGEIGFDGFLISDAIDMHSLRGNLAQRTQSSLEAGCDCICYCFGIYEELEEVVTNCSIMRDKTLLRFESIKKIINNKSMDIDILNLAQDYSQAIGSIEEYDDNYDATEVLHLMKNKGEI